ncbi:MAG: hypothetical protein R8K22_06965, partial [Mariprofundaceae bacterium]
MHKYFSPILVGAVMAMAWAQPMVAQAKRVIPDAINPVSIILEDKKREIIYPSVSGDFLVYSQRKSNEFSVMRVPADNVTIEGHSIKGTQPHEMLRYGVAIADGGIGYVSNRMGPTAAWLHQAEGDGHIAIANMGTFRGALMPANLSASKDGNVWCFDSSLQKTRRARILDDYKDGYQHEELMGQTWRIYHSDAWRWKAGYWATETGTRNDFEKPALFIFDRKTSQLTMIPHAFGGAISPDGKQVVFTREMDGNYDLWTQKIDGSGLVQL